MAADSQRRTRLRVLAALAALIVALPLALSTRSAETLASWTDDEVAAGTFSAATVGPPSATSCTSGLLESATFIWAHPTTGLTRTSYHIVLTRNGNTLVDNATVSSSSTSYTIPINLLAIGNGTFSVRAVSGTWESTAATGTYSVLGLLLSLHTTCKFP